MLLTVAKFPISTACLFPQKSSLKQNSQFKTLHITAFKIDDIKVPTKRFKIGEVNSSLQN